MASLWDCGERSDRGPRKRVRREGRSLSSLPAVGEARAASARRVPAAGNVFSGKNCCSGVCVPETHCQEAQENPVELPRGDENRKKRLELMPCVGLSHTGGSAQRVCKTCWKDILTCSTKGELSCRQTAKANTDGESVSYSTVQQCLSCFSVSWLFHISETAKRKRYPSREAPVRSSSGPGASGSRRQRYCGTCHGVSVRSAFLALQETNPGINFLVSLFFKVFGALFFFFFLFLFILF